MTPTLGKKYSFVELLENNSFTISIPLIQRDYVQGLQNKEEVRNDFLNTLKSYLIKGENKDLDFVYGFINNNKFIPLDGQQRLTTLFLLHTYLAIQNDKLEDWKNILTSSNNFKFLYEVRRSSTQFCECLIRFGIDFTDFEKSKKKYPTLKSYVSNLFWYKDMWNQDPTISSMINMLASIHKEFNEDICGFYDKLFRKENPILTFLFLDLENLNKGDELYIKMNARGKMLSNFENFKARFEEKIVHLFKENDIKRHLTYKDQNIEMSTKEYFSFKLDSVWSNLFWKYRDLVGSPDNYDDEIFNFIKEILIIHYIKNANSDNIEEILNADIQTFNFLDKLGLINRASIEYLISVFDVIPYNEKGIIRYCNNRYFDEENVFKSVLSHKIQNRDRIKFFCYIEFLLNGQNEISALQDWMRIVTNLVENKILNTQDMIIPAFQSMVNLLPYANKILQYLSTKPKILFFDSSQIQEEIIKSKLIEFDSKYYADIFEAEQNVFHAGQVAYLLEYSGILNHFDLNNLEIKKLDNINTSFSKFLDYSIKSNIFFSFLDNNHDFIFERSLLCYGKYMINKNDNQYNFSSSRSVANYERDYSWKRMLSIDFDNINDNYWKEKREIILQVFDDVDFDFSNVEQSLLNNIKSYNATKDWQYDFIKNPAFLRACKQGFINTFNNFIDIQILNASQMNHLWMDYYVFKFHQELENLNIIHSLDYVKGYYDVPSLGVYNFIIDRKSYTLQFYTMENAIFYIRFFKDKGYNKIEHYGSKIEEELLSLGLKWNDDSFHQGFTFCTKNYKKATDLYLRLNSIITTLS